MLFRSDEVQVEGDYLRILGRRSEIINVGGEKVYPAEVESVIQVMSNIADVIVRGETNPITGQTVIAQVTLKEPEEPIALRKRIRKFCQGQLAPYKIPTKVFMTSEAQHNPRFKKMRRKAPGQKIEQQVEVGRSRSNVVASSLNHSDSTVTR